MDGDGKRLADAFLAPFMVFPALLAGARGNRVGNRRAAWRSRETETEANEPLY